jgi:hypothetical protein
MAQKYGTTPVSALLDEPTSPEGAGESSALLGGDRDGAVKLVNGKREGKASMVSSVSNLANTIIGSGESLTLWSFIQAMPTFTTKECSCFPWSVFIATRRVFSPTEAIL